MSQYNAQCSALKDALPKDKLQHTDIHTVISSQGNTDNLLYIHLTDLYNQSLYICTIIRDDFFFSYLKLISAIFF